MKKRKRRNSDRKKKRTRKGDQRNDNEVIFDGQSSSSYAHDRDNINEGDEKQNERKFSNNMQGKVDKNGKKIDKTKNKIRSKKNKNIATNSKIDEKLNFNVEIIPLQDCYVPIKKRFIYFDHINTFGQDIKQYVNANSLVTVNIGNDISSFSQGVFRLRSIGMNQKIFFMIPLCLVKLMNINTNLFKDHIINNSNKQTKEMDDLIYDYDVYDNEEMFERFKKNNKNIIEMCNKNYSEDSQTESEQNSGSEDSINGSIEDDGDDNYHSNKGNEMQICKTKREEGNSSNDRKINEKEDRKSVV